MKSALASALILVASPCAAQQATLNDPLLDRLKGEWVISGTIAGKPTTHDVSAEWVIEHQYLRLHEVTREKRADGQPDYEAVVHVGWNQPTGTYGCVWLDNYGGLNTQSIGLAAKKENELPFVFSNLDRTFTRTTMAYDPKSGTWRWTIVEDNAGKLSTFADLTLTRK